jgi:hypothetical protein
MPQVLTDPTLNAGVITNGGSDLFSYPNVQRGSVLGLQTPSTQPLPPGTSTATNLISPPLQVASQLSNFPSNVYDVSPTSMLYHFMAALLGDAGTGQLLRRNMISRLQQAITSTNFYDLDSFYGALFGAQRGPSGSLPVNPATGQPVSPYTDLASPDGWDEIQAADAVFRERIIQLARAITLGGTVPGLLALAEAVTGVTCQIWEAWRLGAGATSPAGRTWAQVTSAYATWSATVTQTWEAVEGDVPFINVNGIPSEVVIEPRKQYSSMPAGLAEQGADMFGVLSVVEVLRPAASLVSFAPNGISTMVPLVIAGAWADSENWELTHAVTPPSASSPAYSAVANSYQGVNTGQLPAGSYVQPRPPLSRSGSGQYSYAGEVSSAVSRAVQGFHPGRSQVTDGQNFQAVAFPRGSTTQYQAQQAVMAPGRAASARAASGVAVKCAPYSGPRVPAATT